MVQDFGNIIGEAPLHDAASGIFAPPAYWIKTGLFISISNQTYFTIDMHMDIRHI